MFTRKFSQTIFKNQLGFLTTSAIKLCFMQLQGWYSLTFINFQENYQIVEIYFYSYQVIPLYKTISNYFVNYLLPNLIPWPLPFWLKLRIFTNKIKYVSITIITLNGQATMGEKYYCLPTKREKNYWLPRKNINRLSRWTEIVFFQKEEHIVFFLPFLEVTKDTTDFINVIEKKKVKNEHFLFRWTS